MFGKTVKTVLLVGILYIGLSYWLMVFIYVVFKLTGIMLYPTF